MLTDSTSFRSLLAALAFIELSIKYSFTPPHLACYANSRSKAAYSVKDEGKSILTIQLDIWFQRWWVASYIYRKETSISVCANWWGGPFYVTGKVLQYLYSICTAVTHSQLANNAIKMHLLFLLWENINNNTILLHIRVSAEFSLRSLTS